MDSNGSIKYDVAEHKCCYSARWNTARSFLFLF